MKQLITPLIYLLTGTLLFTSCKKDKKPPNEVVTVNNMSFGARVNGQPFIADLWDYGNNIPPLKIKMLYNSTYNYNYMWIRADKANTQISLYIKPPLIIGRKLLNKTTLPYPSQIRPEDYGMYSVFYPSKDYRTTDEFTGFIEIINVDTVQNRIEAKFEFEAINSQTGEKVKVTNGYFKLN